MENTMLTDITQHKNYGKDLLTLQRDAEFTFSEKIAMAWISLRMIKRIRSEIGFRKMLEMFKSTKPRVAEMMDSDALTEIRQSGVSEQDLEEMVDRIALGEAMSKFLGLEKAKIIRTSLSEEIASVFFTKLFPTYEELDSLPGGYLPNLKKFISTYAEQNNQTKIEIGEIQEDSETGFTYTITDCKFARVAEIMGDREICYWTTCITDLFFFPAEAEKAGIYFNRGGTIASGQKVCDFCWRK
jgi:hypothetical protein